ncbi:MAG: YdeI/OmpD-associated family protein [Rikenellaceae bacterium]|jgi:uncharacterized protein YdeI (YjbR/CyaY-like superfamily)|nr:YdeI/OmpD-associated family protein [Rikenellaceae bacterium]
MKPDTTPTYFETREEWRRWLADNFETAKEVWFTFPNKSSGKSGISYNDAVEEALCFGWIDSTIRALDADHKIQRFTPRRPRSPYSQSNKERLAWLQERGMIHPKFEAEVQAVLSAPFVFSADIIARLKEDPAVWANYQRFSPSYQRLRVAYIEQARVSDEEFEKRLRHFIAKTRDGKLIPGYGGIDKYY